MVLISSRVRYVLPGSDMECPWYLQGRAAAGGHCSCVLCQMCCTVLSLHLAGVQSLQPVKSAVTWLRNTVIGQSRMLCCSQGLQAPLSSLLLPVGVHLQDNRPVLQGVLLGECSELHCSTSHVQDVRIFMPCNHTVQLRCHSVHLHAVVSKKALRPIFACAPEPGGPV